MFGRGKHTLALKRRMAALDALRAKVMVADTDLTIVQRTPTPSPPDAPPRAASIGPPPSRTPGWPPSWHCC
ncbi:hypothetical protein CRT60_07620 [Azospirillum palustre]|uniref:Uncharacterized protein n=1 Tax=Azospirillum palustre TaxID=2044885 RepID=A0A2B8BGD9_9PROT|nr:hypothetical protein CRT60_07620 [Azospirillum palustre]